MRTIQILGNAGLVCCVALAGLQLTNCSGDDSSSGSTPDAASDTSPPIEGGPTEGGADARDEGHPLGGQNDRAGRVATTFALIDPAHRDLWNRKDTFDPALLSLTPEIVRDDMQARLARWDLVDGVDDWDGGPEGGTTVVVPVDAGPDADGGTAVARVYHPIIPTFQTDVLLVDTTKPFGPASYLDIEFATLVSKTPGAHATCGGRWLNDDAVDKTLSFLIKRKLSGVSDGVDAPAKPASMTFPYVQAP